MKLSEAHTEATYYGAIGPDIDAEVIARFTIEGEPETKARARWSKRSQAFYTPQQTRSHEARIAAAYLSETRRSNGADTRGTFGVIAIFFRATAQRRDVDNMVKAVLDGLNGVAWADDNQVTEVIARKVAAVPSDKPRTEILIYRSCSTQPIKAGSEGVCPSCNDTFYKPPSHHAKIYCSQKCRAATSRMRRSRTCEACGATFLVPGKSYEQRYCSVACKNAASQVEVECARCGIKFKKARSLNRSGNSYCSDDCKAAYWRERRRSAAKGTCTDCGGPTTKKSYKRCKTCLYAAGGRWADRRVEDVRCPSCQQFIPDNGEHSC